MTEYTKLIERLGERYGVPELSTDQLLSRRDRKHRNQRIAAGVVGIAVFVAAVWIVTSISSLDRSETSVVPGQSGTTEPAETGPNGPYAQPTYELGRVTTKDIELGESFIDAWTDGNGEAAAAMFASDGNFDGFQPAILPALHDWFRAEGWAFKGEGCGLHGWGPQRGAVGCGLTYENDLTRGLGMPPVETTISFLTDGDKIATAWYGAGGDLVFDMFAGYRGRGDVLGPIWDTFLDWISSRHPEDFVRMYDPDHSYPILDAASTELWKRRTGEFLASPQAQALARSIRDAGWDGVGFPPEGTAPSTPTVGQLIDGYDATRGPDFVFVYADGRVISSWDGTQSTDTAFYEQRLTPEGVGLVRSGAVSPEEFLSPAPQIPADAWENPETKAFVPSRYAVCFYQDSGDANPGTINHGYEYPSRVIRFFPARARDILVGNDHTYDEDNRSEGPIECSELTTNEARTFDSIVSGLTVKDAEGDRIFVEMNELLPHGEWVVQAG